MSLRTFLSSGTGKVIAAVLSLAAIGAVIYSARSTFGPTDAETASANRWFVCAKTGKPFRVKLTLETQIPVKSPHSGENSGYPSELCFWTKDGQPKSEPTPVLLNETVGREGPTFCPDCDRLVVGHNPHPSVARGAPPLQSEYKPVSRRD